MERLMSANFDFNDFLKQWQNMNNMGGMSMMKLLPGFNKVCVCVVKEKGVNEGVWDDKAERD
jgi:signal recognition particle subunit SRP54